MSPSHAQRICWIGLLALFTWSSGCVTEFGDELGNGGASTDGGSPQADFGAMPDGLLSGDLQFASGIEPGTYSFWRTQSSAAQVRRKDKVQLFSVVRSDDQGTLANGELWVESVSPSGKRNTLKTGGVHLEIQTETKVAQNVGPFAEIGDWFYVATLRNAAGEVLSAGPNNTVRIRVLPDVLEGIVAYKQINGVSCGSHSGAVTISYLKGLRGDVGAATAMEHAIFGRMAPLPGEPELKAGYNSYMRSAGIPYTAVSIGSGDVGRKLEDGMPVVAHVNNHYICVYGLVEEGGQQIAYVSDGATGYGTSGSWSIGDGGHRRKIPWGSLLGSLAGGFVSFNRR